MLLQPHGLLCAPKVKHEKLPPWCLYGLQQATDLRATGPPGSIAAARPLAGVALLALPPSAGAARGAATAFKAVEEHPHSSCNT